MIWTLVTQGEVVLRDPTLAELERHIADPGANVWVNLTPPVSDDEISLLRDVFKFHPLAIEDCIGEREQPKVDDYESYLYLITHGLAVGATAEDSETVELDVFVGDNYIVTHHHRPSRSIEGVREAIERTGLPLRRSHMAVLHAILDRQVDGFEPMLERIEERITQLEDAIFVRPTTAHLGALLAVRRNILHLRRWVGKQRDVLARLGRGEFRQVKKPEQLLFRNVHDHLVRFTDILDNYRDMSGSIIEAHLSVTSNRLNEVMRFLTVWTAMLMPLTVITGVYGMNFQHMPELAQPWGYYAVLGLMAAISVGLFTYFRHRGWLGRPPEVPPAPQVEPASPRQTAPRPRS